MKTALIASTRPVEVAHEVERLFDEGYRRFVLRPIDHGGMLDLERLGAARYAAALHATVELEEEPAAIAATR